MYKSFLVFLISIFFVVLVGCVPETADVPATEEITETATVQSPSPSALPGPGSDTPAPEEIATPESYSIVTRTPSLTPNPAIRPSRTPTPTRTPKPLRAPIEILYPGPDSKVVDEVELRAYVQPGKDGRITTQLIGEDGRTIFEQSPRYTIGPDVWGYIVVRIPITSPLAGEFCRLQVVTRDEFNRLMAVNGVHILVLSGGYPEINPADRVDARIRVTNPKVKDEVFGNLMLVEGKIRPVNDRPLIIALIDEAGNILASSMVPMPDRPTGGEIPFDADLSYSINSPVQARLTLYQEDNRMPGIMYLYSQEVPLKP